MTVFLYNNMIILIYQMTFERSCNFMKNRNLRLMGTALLISMSCNVLPVSAVYANSNEANSIMGSEVELVDGTTGTPLGGFGAGAVKFNAVKGKFAATTRPPADQTDYSEVGTSRFQLYTDVNGNVEIKDNMTAVSTGGRYADDAIWPEHNVDFGEINGIQISLKGYSPLDNVNYDNMSLPYALYEFTLTNNNSTEANASVAMLWDLGADRHKAAWVKETEEKGFISDKWAIYAKSEGAEITSGGGNEFFEKGICETKPSLGETRTAVKVNIPANESKSIKLVLAWYDDSDPEGAYYLSKYSNAGDIALHGLEYFDTLKNNGDGLVQRFRKSNVPAWFVNQCLNSLINISNNSIYKTDGRTAFAEGEWTCFGTMDQMWHARYIINYLIPDFAWQELEYWARTQRNDGQIHHDFNYMTDTSVKYKLVDWDDTEHEDYRNIDKWVDLNCGFIISVYETYRQTGNEEKLEYFWPYIKKAAQRVLKQVELYGDKDYPYTFSTSQNSYDAGGNPNPFNSSISAVMYKIMTILGEKMNEPEITDVYKYAYNTVVESFRQRYLNNNFPAERVSESYFAGQWLAIHLKLGEIWTKEETDYVLNCLDGYYHPYYNMLGFPQGTYNEWTPYLLMHYGGLLLNTQRQNQFEVLQKDSYTRQFKNRDYVFNHPLDILPQVTSAKYVSNNISGDRQYISIPSIWRNYYDMIGYYRDCSTKELWLKPQLLPEMNHEMTNAAYVSSEGYGTISCKEMKSEGSEAYQNKIIEFKPEKNIYVSNLYLQDNFGADESIKVTINNEKAEFKRIGEGYTKELEVNYNNEITSDGILISVSGNPGAEPPAVPEKPDDFSTPPPIAEISAYSDIEAEQMSASGGIEIAEDDVRYITECDDQDYAKYDSVGFDEAAGAISLTVRSTKQSHIELALDSVSGETVQILEIPNTNNEWKTIEYKLEKKILNTHDIVFRFRSNTGDSSNLVDIDKFRFEYKYKLKTDKWSASASKQSKNAYLAFDGDETTRWATGGKQEGNEWFVLDLGEKTEFNRLILESTAASKNDYPRRYEVYVSDDGVNFSECAASGEGTAISTEIKFIRQNARYIKICQLGETDTNYWSIYEMAVYNDEEDYPDGNHEPTPTLAPDLTINNYTYTGVKSSNVKGTKYFDIDKYKVSQKAAKINTINKEFYFDEEVDENVRNYFADGSDKNKISSSYTTKMVNYIGTSGEYNIRPAITDISLKAGKYRLYYIGGTTSPSRNIEIEFSGDKGNVKLSDMNSYVFSKDGLTMNEFELTLGDDYSGDIIFGNTKTWLPDLYSVKLVPVLDREEPEYRIIGTEMLSKNGERISEIPVNEEFGINIEIKNTKEENSKNSLITVLYDKDSRVISVKSEEVVFDKTGMKTIHQDIGVQSEKISEIRFFIWDNVNSMKPICDKVKIE